ncbi:MAG: DNA-directed RNA polymerases I, II, and III subunit RPABC3 [Peltula sp. TS41687]|nr:MAG: DNA-directed RNA polymerases I, II, and III subunit RPABC3 [Peltula sp. TS41687]
MATSDTNLFEDTFQIALINSAKYDRVSRISGHNLANDTEFSLDVNTELYPLMVNETVQLVLASTLALDGSKDDGKGWRDISAAQQQQQQRSAGAADATLADMFDYVCHGKIYRFEEGDGENIRVYISFGGLLLYMNGPYKKLTTLRMDYVYLLLKR